MKMDGQNKRTDRAVATLTPASGSAAIVDEKILNLARLLARIAARDACTKLSLE